MPLVRAAARGESPERISPIGSAELCAAALPWPGVAECQLLGYVPAVTDKNDPWSSVSFDLYTAHAHVVEQKVLHFLPRDAGIAVPWEAITMVLP